MNKEREIYLRGILLRNEDATSRTVSGYAVRFNEESQNIGFYETISPEAITEDVIKNSDIYALLNHREDIVLARSRYGEGSLKLELREDGLFYSFEAPKTTYGDELLEHIKRGEIFSSSFAFTIPEDEDAQVWEKKDGTYYRTIKKIDRLYDISPVYEPAYLTTSCSNRAKVEIDKLEAAEELRKQDVIQSLNKKLEVILEDNKDLFNL